jgi:hypothetical protein
MLASYGPALLLVAALAFLAAEWRAEPACARRHVVAALALGALMGSGRLYLARAGIGTPAPLAWDAASSTPRFLWDVLGYAAWTAMGLSVSARVGLQGMLLVSGGDWRSWRRALLLGLGTALPLALLTWLVYRFGIGVMPLPQLALNSRRALILAAHSVLYQETMLRLAILPLAAWLVAAVTRLRQESGWPLVAGVIVATVAGGVAFPGAGVLLTLLYGLAAGYVLVRAGWESAVLAHLIWATVPLLALLS